MAFDPAKYRNRRGEEAVVLYDFETSAPGQLGLKRGQRLEIVERREDGWWVGRRDGEIGLVNSQRIGMYKDKEFARALFDYNSGDASHLVLAKGQRVTVWVRRDAGWSVGEVDGSIGLFPGNYVEWLGQADDSDFSDATQNSSRSGSRSRGSAASGGGEASAGDGQDGSRSGSGDRRRQHRRRTTGGDAEPYESEDDSQADSSEFLLSSNYSSEGSISIPERYAKYRPAVPIPTAKDRDDIRVLLQMLDSDDDQQARDALEGLTAFFTKDKSGLMAKRHGAIPALVVHLSRLFHIGKPLVVKRQLDKVLKFLLFLVEDDQRAACDVHDCGATSQLIGFLATKAHETSKALARQLLIVISKDNLSCQTAIIRSGGVPVLCKLLTASDHDLRRDACIVLSRVLYGVGPAAQRAVAAAPSAIPGMVTVLNTPRPEVLMTAAANVTHLVRGNKTNQNLWREAHGLLALANLIGYPDERVQMQAAGALMELARDNKTNAKAICGGTTATVHLVNAVRSQAVLMEPNEDHLNNVLGATWMLVMQSQSNCEMFLEHGLLFALMPLVEREYRLAHTIAFRLQRHFPKIVVEQFWHYREEVSKHGLTAANTNAYFDGAEDSEQGDNHSERTDYTLASQYYGGATYGGDDASTVAAPPGPRGANGMSGRALYVPPTTSAVYYPGQLPVPVAQPGSVAAFTGPAYGAPAYYHPRQTQSSAGLPEPRAAAAAAAQPSAASNKRPVLKTGGSAQPVQPANGSYTNLLGGSAAQKNHPPSSLHSAHVAGSRGLFL